MDHVCFGQFSFAIFKGTNYSEIHLIFGKTNRNQDDSLQDFSSICIVEEGLTIAADTMARFGGGNIEYVEVY